MSGRLVPGASVLLCLLLGLLFGRFLVLAVPKHFAHKRSDCGNDEDDGGAFASLTNKELGVDEEERDREAYCHCCGWEVVEVGS